MQVLDIAQIRAWDEYTIINEPIDSLNLMERAGKACFNWLMNQGHNNKAFAIFCGKGNNGGDGLVIARLLTENGYDATVYILESGNPGTKDFQANLSLLQKTAAPIIPISESLSLSSLAANTIVIDAMYGSGINKPLEGLNSLIVEHLNNSGHEIVSIDMPSGLNADKSSTGNIVIEASHTVSFQCFKLAFLMAENERYLGLVHILDIGLHPGFLETILPTRQLIDESLVRSFFKKRKLFAHKGLFGHAALLAGSSGMMGAAILAARACMRTGVGRLTCHIPALGITIMQLAIPEAMCVVEQGKEFITTFSSPQKYSALGIGPGLGRQSSNSTLLSNCFIHFKNPMVLDADALNCLATDSKLLDKIPKQTILTPHIKEFEHLFGAARNDFERMHKAIQKANELQIVIVLKGRYTLVASPGHCSYFNVTGNPGMAKAGNGDVLTGMILAFLSQGYNSVQAACLGVYLHGSAADEAIKGMAMESLLPSDTIGYIGTAINKLY